MTELPPASNARPSNIVLFEQLWYLSLGIGVVQSIMQWQRLVDLAHAVGRGGRYILLLQAIGFAVQVFFIWLIARRRKNWARWVWLILFVIGLPFSLPMLNRLLHGSPIGLILASAQILDQAVALYLVFTGNAREWFKSQFIPPSPA
jgi:hypothetical protein